MAQVRVFHSFRPANYGSEEWRDSSGTCQYRSFPGVPNYFVKETRHRLMARSAMTAKVQNFSTVYYSDMSPEFCGIHTLGDVDIPSLPLMPAQFRVRAKSKDYSKRVKRGDIVVNNMSRSSLTMVDSLVVKPGASASEQLLTFNCNSLYRAPRFSTQCNRNLFDLHNGWFATQTYAPYPAAVNYHNGSTVQCKYLRTDSANLIPRSVVMGITNARLRLINEEVTRYLLSLPRDQGLVTKVAGDTRAGTYDVLTDIAEARSTIELIGTCVLRILKEYSNVRKRIAKRPSFNVLGKKNILHEATDEWMQYRYAISPTLLSLNNALEWLETRKHEYFKYRGTLSREIEPLTLPGGLVIRFPHLTDRAFGKTRLDGATSGLKINPLATGLELIPLSFLLNWVCNIGDYVSALWPPSGAVQEVYTYSRQLSPTLLEAEVGGESIQFMYGFYDIAEINPADHRAVTFGWAVTWKRWLDAFALTYEPLRKSIYTKPK